MNMKKLGVIAAAAVISTATAACSDGNDKEKADLPVSVSVWHYYNGAQKEAFDDMVQQFNETVGEKEGIQVRSFSKGGIQELETSIKDAANEKVGSEDLPDICAAYADMAYEVGKKVPLVDFNKYWSKEEQEGYVQAYIEEGYLNGSLNLFPVAKSTEILGVNETDWDKFQKATGVSEEEFSTWEGIVRLAEKYYQWTDDMTPELYDGKAFFGRDAFANYMLVGSAQLGHEIFRVEDGEMVLDFDEATMRRLWDCYYVPYVKGYFASYGKFRTDDVKTGDLIAFVGSTSGMTYFPKTVTKSDGSTYEITGKMYPLPNFEGEEGWAVQQGAGMLLFKSDEAHEKAAVRFLKWFTEEDNNLSYCTSSSYLPVKKVSSEMVEKDVRQSEGISNIMAASLIMGQKMTEAYRLYTTPAFYRGDKAREIINISMDQKARQDRETVKNLVSQGMTEEEAISQTATEENFKAWYHGTLEELKKLEG